MHTATYSSMLLQSSDTCSSSICSLMAYNPSFSLFLLLSVSFFRYFLHTTHYTAIYIWTMSLTILIPNMIYAYTWNNIILFLCLKIPITFDQIHSFHMCLFLFLSLDFNKQVSVKNGIFCIVIWPFTTNQSE